MRVPPFLFIRHGETAWNAEGRLQGQHDVPLNEVGREQAAAAGRQAQAALCAAGHDPAATPFAVSPLWRTRETAEIARDAIGLPPQGYDLDERLKELSFGAWEGLTWPDVKRRDPLLRKARQRDKWRFVPPGGESYADLAERVRPWLATVRDPMVVVAHGGVARALLVLVGGASILAAPNTDIYQGRVLRFAHGRSAWL